MSTNEPLVELFRAESASRMYARGGAEVVALAEATCIVRRAELVCITGPSGSGKSTLIHLMAGIDNPSVGSVEWPAFGASPLELSPGIVGLVFQGPSLIAFLDVGDNVAFPLVLGGVLPTKARAEAERILGELDLVDLITRAPEDLSGGQAQRVAVARALLTKPRLILADEPTGQLDRDNGLHVIDLLVEHAATSGAALVVTTHDPEVASRFKTQWTMRDGRLSVDGEVAC